MAALTLINAPFLARFPLKTVIPKLNNKKQEIKNESKGKKNLHGF